MNPHFLRDLRHILPPRQIVSSPADLLVYECDAYVAAKQSAGCVVFPTTTEQVAQIVKLACKYLVPVVPRGAGTGLAGGSLPEDGCVLIALSRMNRIEEIDIGDRVALVQAGVVNGHLTQAVSGDNLCFAPDPSSQAACTIGGNIAANSGGPHTLKHGVTANHTLGVELVTPQGDIVWLGNRVEGSPGLDLLGACVGSEGTLGIVTRAWVKLSPLPPSAHTLLAIFNRFEDGARAVTDVIGAGIIPAALEMLDDVFLPCIEDAYHFGFPLDAGAILLIETDGLHEVSREEATRAAQICRAAGAREVREAKEESERKLLWAARKGAFGAIGRITRSYVTQDGVVPRSKLAEVLQFVQSTARQYDVRIGNVFHAGDGNLHPCILYDERVPGELDKVLAAGEAILKKCLELGGSVSGEHGIGIEKINLMPLAFTPDTLSAMADVRGVFNPESQSGGFNPSKLLPTNRGCVEIGRAYQKAARETQAGVGFVRRGAPM